MRNQANPAVCWLEIYCVWKLSLGLLVSLLVARDHLAHDLISLSSLPTCLLELGGFLLLACRVLVFDWPTKFVKCLSSLDAIVWVIVEAVGPRGQRRYDAQ